MNAYFVLWPNDWCKRLIQAGDNGPLDVLYGGPHSSVPSLSKVASGDLIYPVAVKEDHLFILGSLQVTHITEAGAYLETHNINKENRMWDTSAPELLKQHPMLGHRIPRTCVDHAAIGSGTRIWFDFSILTEIVSQLRFGPKAAQEKALSINSDSKLSAILLQGHYRRLSVDSAKLIADLMQGF